MGCIWSLLWNAYGRPSKGLGTIFFSSGSCRSTLKGWGNYYNRWLFSPFYHIPFIPLIFIFSVHTITKLHLLSHWSLPTLPMTLSCFFLVMLSCPVDWLSLFKQRLVHHNHKTVSSVPHQWDRSHAVQKYMLHGQDRLKYWLPCWEEATKQGMELYCKGHSKYIRWKNLLKLGEIYCLLHCLGL